MAEKTKMKILIICCTDVKSDPRVQRQIKALKGHEITTIGSSNGDYKFYDIPAPSWKRKVKRFLWLTSGQYEKFYWIAYLDELKSKFINSDFDHIIANDIYSLPLAINIKSFTGGKVYFDAHEYHPKEWASLKWKLLYQRYVKYLCKKYIPKADTFSTVSYGIAEEYKKFVRRKPEVITNAGEYQNLSLTKVHTPIRLIHHGIAVPERRIEKMIQMMEYLPSGYELTLMLVPTDKKYYTKLKQFSNSRIKFLDSVPREQVCKTLNEFDIGVYRLPASSFNNLHALPNKIYDFIQARLTIVVSPNPEMAHLVRKYELGTVAKGYSPLQMAQAVYSLNKYQIQAHKNYSDSAAKKLNAENNYERIQKLAL